MKQYYQDLFTDKSFSLLNKLNRQIKFVLIGGWAVWLYTKSLKSKDVDFIVSYAELSVLQSRFAVVKNERLRKYDMVEDGISVDIYVPYYSFIGIPIEELTELKIREGEFTVLTKEALLLTKQTAYKSRFASIKGQKDKIDIISLISLPDFNFEKYHALLQKYKFTIYENMLKNILRETHEVKELNLNSHAFSKLKREIEEKLE